MKFEEMVESFQKNDNEAFEYIYNTCGAFCINTLVSKRNCAREDAKDFFVDAVLIFRDKLISNEIEYLTNLKSYIFRICENNYLAQMKKEASNQSKSDEIVERFYEEKQEVNPLFGKAAKFSWSQLSEKCKDIIYLFYVESISMEDIAKQLNLANADTAKSTKSRCYKKYVSVAREYQLRQKDEAD